jgi:hypothetical protein
VDTGAAKFQIRKANTNIIDKVEVGATTVVQPSTSETRGLVLLGPSRTATTAVTSTVQEPYALGGLISGTYTSGGTITGSAGQYCTVGSFTSGTATARLVLTGTDTIAGGTALTTISSGAGATSAPTSATLGTGTATCSGSVVVSTVIGARVSIGDSTGVTTIVLSGGSAVTAATVASDINAGAPAGVTASASGGYVVITSNVSGVGSVVRFGAAPTASAHTIIGLPVSSAHNATVTCSPDVGGGACTTIYSSANDDNSTCAIDSGQNGPIAAVIKCYGTHKDASDNPYMQFTTRSYFSRGKTSVKVTSVLRNANYDTSAAPSPDKGYGKFNPAYKGFEAYELRVSPDITGSLTYTIAGHAGNQTGTVTGDAYAYQGQSLFLYATSHVSTDNRDSFTTDSGYVISNNSSTLATGTNADTQPVPGWADISDSAGKGMTIGFYQMAAHFPKSLEFNSGGSDVRLGIWPRMNSKPMYQAWPQWAIHDLYMDFHASAVTANEARDNFLRLQHYLVARADRTHYNSTNVFYVPIPSPTEEDAYFVSRAAGGATPANPTISLSNYCYGGGTTNCSPDYGTTTSFGLTVYKQYGWSAGGGGNQQEFRWANLMEFLQRGTTGRLLNSAHFYRFQAERAWPHADGATASDGVANNFTWRSRPCWSAVIGCGPGIELDGFGRPDYAAQIIPVNRSLSYTNWLDSLHYHWWGMTDYYFLSGDETVRDAMIPMKDWYLNDATYQGANNGTATGSSGAFGIIRQTAIEMTSSAKFGEFLRATGDSDYQAVWDQGEFNYEFLIRPDACVSNYPNGCTMPPETGGNNGEDPPGINRKRGYPASFSGRAGVGSPYWCSESTSARRQLTSFQGSMLVESLLIYRHTRGPSWQYYKEALDLAYGVGKWVTSESYVDEGSSMWSDADPQDFYNGFGYLVWADKPAVCTDGAGIQVGAIKIDDDYKAGFRATTWMAFYVQYLVTGDTSWKRRFDIALDRLAAADPNAPEKGTYQVALLIDAVNHPTSTPLRTISSFSFNDNGDNTYSLGWTKLGGTTSHRVKWSTLAVTDWIGFDVFNFDWIGNPATQDNWFAATDAGDPTCDVTTCSITVNAGQTGLTASNFSVKAYSADAGAGSTSSGRIGGAGRISGAGRIQ